MKSILGFETYGRLPFHKRMLLDLKNRFKTNPTRDYILNQNNVGSYIPKLNARNF